MHLPATFLSVTLIALIATANAQDAPGNSAQDIWQQRQQLQAQLIEALRPVIQECMNAGWIDTADKIRGLLIPRDPQRQYIFLPPENGVETSAITGLEESMQGRVDGILSRHADRLFKFARGLADDELGCAAFQNLNEVLFFNPNHESARKALGHRVIDVDGTRTWRVKSDRLQIKPATKPHPDFNWPARQYLIASTTSFQIASRANEPQTQHLAEQLELWQDVWRQVFFSYYDRAKNVGRRMDGKSRPGNRNRQYKIVFFADKDEYVRSLRRLVPGIEGSTGYYDDKLETSFFYASDDGAIEDTWRHELTHQLFQESRRSVVSPFRDQHLWLGEGIAMYFESMVHHGDYAVVGGFDARRLQYARLRRLKEQFRIPLRELAHASKDQFQAIPELAKVYSQSAGLTHYLMDSEYGAFREPLIEFLRLSYQGKLKPDSFEQIMGQSYDDIETAYDKFLRVAPESLATLDAPAKRTELCLIGATLRDDSLESVGRCNNLRWLDLSACDVRGQRLMPLKSITRLGQLFLTGARIDEHSVQVLAHMPVVELDLSGTNLTDDGLEILATGARNLKALNVEGTRVTREGLNKLASRRPELQVNADM